MTAYVKVDESIGQNDIRVFFGLNTDDPIKTQFLRNLKDLRYDIYRSSDGVLASGAGKTFQDPSVSFLGLRPSTLAADAVLDALQFYPSLYVAAFTVAKFEADGTPVAGPDYSAITLEYEVRWQWTYEDGDDTFTGTSITKLKVLDPTTLILDGPVQLEDAVEEGFVIDDTITPAAGTFTSVRLKDLIDHAVELAERFTEKTFGPKVNRFRSMGTDCPVIDSPQPMAGLSEVKITTGGSGHYIVNNSLFLDESITDLTETFGDFIVPNRHIRFGQKGWDRDVIYPRLERRHGTFGVENATVDLKGVFGITIPDGTVWGKVPPGVIRAILILAATNSGTAFSQGSQTLPGAVGPLKAIQTDVQKFQYFAPGTGSQSAISGSASPDAPATAYGILAYYKRQMVNVIF